MDGVDSPPMNTETLLNVVTVLFAAASLFMVGGAILTMIQDKADCEAREQMARGIGSAAR